MRKFIESQVKSKAELQAEREASRAEKAQAKADKEALKAEKEREKAAAAEEYDYAPYGGVMGRYPSGQGTIMPASGAEFDSRPHHRHFSERRLANPAPLGLFAFSFSTFLLGLINVRAQGLTQVTAMTAPFLMYSSIMMGITAIFELISGNTFGATAFGTFAGFFLSLGALLLPSFNTFASFTTNPLQVFNFLGLFFATWLIPFGIFCFLTIRSTWTLWLQFIFIFISLAVSCAQYLQNNDPTLQRVAGAFLIVVAFFGYLNGSAGLMAKETVFFQPPVLPMPWSSSHMVAGVKGPHHPDNHRFPKSASQPAHSNSTHYTREHNENTYAEPASNSTTYTPGTNDLYVSAEQPRHDAAPQIAPPIIEPGAYASGLHNDDQRATRAAYDSSIYNESNTRGTRGIYKMA